MKFRLSAAARFFSAALLAFAPPGAQAEVPLDRLRTLFSQAESGQDPLAVIRQGVPLRDRLVALQDYEAAADIALKVAFAADRQGTASEAAAAAGEAHRIVGLSRAGRMRSWDWMLQAQMSGMAVKHLISEGRPAAASQRQALAWQAIRGGVREETRRDWQPGQALPDGIGDPLLGMILRTARYDGELLSLAGHTVEAVARLRKLEQELTRSGRMPGVYGNQLLGFLVGEQKFLGFRDDALTMQERLIAQAGPESQIYRNACFNRAYWRSQWEGPRPEFLIQAKAASSDPGAPGGIARTTRRLLAKMAFAYQEAGFDPGELAVLAREAAAAGDEMEALSTLGDLARIQRRRKDFAPAEANLLAALTAARATGRKRAEPSLYREYAILLEETGRPREAIRMARGAIRLTKSFQWTQHLPGLLHTLARAQYSAGDLAGLRVTMAELQALLASGVLEPSRTLDAGLALAWCQHALGRPEEAAATRELALATARQKGVSAYEIDEAGKFPFTDFPPPATAVVPGAGSAVELQPLSIHSALLPDETARVRFTLSNPSSVPAPGTLVLTGNHLAAAWQDASGTGRMALLPTGGDSELRHPLTLAAGEEFLLVAGAVPGRQGKVGVRWEPERGSVQESGWTLTAAADDGTAIAVTNANLASRNPFYALRLHHAFQRRGGDPAAPVDLRTKASRPMRIELLHPDTGELLAIDANGDGQFDGPGDVLPADANQDGFPDLACPLGSAVEIALLIYPLTSHDPAGEATLDLQLRHATGWATAARNVLK